MLYATEPFEEGKEFRRTAAQSPIFLQYHNEVEFHDKGYSGKRPGFKIFTYDEKLENRKEVGYVIVAAFSDVLSINWLRISESEQGKGYATAAIETIMSVYRKKHSQFFSGASHFFFSTNTGNKAMLRIGEKLGFTPSTRLYPHPGMLRFEKPIKE